MTESSNVEIKYIKSFVDTFECTHCGTEIERWLSCSMQIFMGSLFEKQHGKVGLLGYLLAIHYPELMSGKYLAVVWSYRFDI